MVAPAVSQFPLRRLVLPILFLVIVLGVGFRSVLFGSQTLSAASYVAGVLPSGPVDAPPPPWPRPMRDPEGAAWVNEPVPSLVHDTLRQSAAPLWNGRTGLGQPLLGNPNAAVLSPFQWIPELRPSSRVRDWTWVLRLFVLGCGTMLLARELRCSPLGAALAGVAITLSGQSVQWIEHHPLNVDAFVPFVLAAAWALRRSPARAGPLLAMAVAAGCFGLKPQSALVAAAAGLFWMAADNSTGAARFAWARILAWSGVGLLLAAVALLPFWSAWDGASRFVDAGRSAQADFVLPLADLPSLLGTWALPGDVPRGLPWAGCLVLLLALVGWVRGRRECLVWALGATVVLFLLRIFGLFPLPLAGWPVIGAIQFVKYCFPFYLGLALLAARGVTGAGRGFAVLALACVSLEMLLLLPLAWPERVDAWRPAGWVDALRAGMAERPGRISGSVQLAPPLVSAALGFRDLRSIDVLTPSATWEYVQRTIAPSQGLVWMLADPDPLLAATGGGGDAADLRWILAREELDPAALPAAVQRMVIGERVVRLFGGLAGYQIRSELVGGGLLERTGDQRFHWTCATPCRMQFDLVDTPAAVAGGFAAEAATSVEVRLALDSAGRRFEERRKLRLEPAAPWREVEVRAMPSLSGPARLELEITAAEPTTVFVGGLGPSPGVSAEVLEVQAELSRRGKRLEELRLHHAGEFAWIYERPDAAGAVFFARSVESVATREQIYACARRQAPGPHVCQLAADIGNAGHGPGFGAPLRAEVVRAELGPGQRRVRTIGGGGLLVFSDLVAEGWVATIDGETVEHAPVNGALVGVPVPPGEHEVLLAYAPWSLRLGGLLSLLGVVVLVAASFAGRLGRQ